MPLTINPHTQRWQERELAARQEATEDFFEKTCFAGVLLGASLCLAGMMVGLVEVQALGSQPNAGFVVFVVGLAIVLALFFVAVVSLLAVDIYKDQRIYAGCFHLRQAH